MESNPINWMQKHKELQDSHLELLREYQQLKERCEKMEASYESFFKQCWPRLIDREVTDEREINNVWLVHKLRNGIEGEGNTPAPGEGEKEVDNG